MNIKLIITGTILFLISTAILSTIYVTWLVYPLEISYLGIEQIVYMKSDEIIYNFNNLMQYLTNPFQTILNMPSFSSSKDGLKHFSDVKQLFHLTQAICLFSFPAFVLFVKNIVKKGYGKLFSKVFIWLALVPVIIGFVGVVIGFDHFFVLFHTILFPGDSTWLFNPNTDPVIYILPEEFFMHCFILFFIFYEVFSLTMLRLVSREKYRL